MRIVLGRGNRRHAVSFPTGPKVGVTPEHVHQMLVLMESHGVRFHLGAADYQVAA